MLRRVCAAWGLVLSGCEPTGMMAVGDTGSETGSGDATTTDADSGGEAPVPPSSTCASYLSCIESEHPELLDAALASYGPGARCWTDPALTPDCDATCEIGLQQMCTTSGGSTGGSGAMPCSLQTLAPGVPSPVVVGTETGRLPPAIGAIFEAHCGCHLVEDPADLLEGVPPYLGALHFRTWDEAQAPFAGQPAWREIERRSIEQLNMPPTYQCDPVDFGALPADDFATLMAWLSADAPDGAAWPP